MKNEFLLLGLAYAVSFTAFIGAINSRGPVKVALSYLLAILTLCLAVFNTSQYLALETRSPLPEEAVVMVPPPLPFPPTTPAPALINPPVGDSAGLSASRNEVAAGETKNELKSILEVARRISQSLSALNLGAVADVSDEEYEALQNKTVGFLSEARRVKERLNPTAVKVSEPLKPAADDLSKGIDALVAAAYNAERFFKSENDTEEKAHLAAFRRGNQTATALFKKAGTELGSDAPAQPADAGE